MQFKDLLHILPNHSLGQQPASSLVTGIYRENAKVVPGSIFVAIKGSSWDGHSAIEEALESGAAIVFAEKYAAKDPRVVIVNNTRKMYAHLHHLLQNKPSEHLFTVGITGTNGKTTTSFLVEEILNHLQKPCGVIGTIDHHLKQKVWPTGLTSPGAEDLQLRLREFLAAGAKAAVMEVSSHSLDQHRVDGTELDAAIFANLTQDHLDYHKTMEQYFLAKSRLFTDLLQASSKKNKVAIINEDDSYAKKIMTGQVSRLGFGMKRGDFRFSIQHMDFNGTHLKVEERGKTFTAEISTIGVHNAYNALAAALVTQALGVGLKESLGILSHARPVTGRLEKITNTKGTHVFVDYAHTPDALERSLSFLREIQQQNKTVGQKLIVVFGAGGNRDTAKRPLMGEIAAKIADIVFITSDNPRYEKPEQIIEEVAAGAKTAKALHKITNRKDAITASLKLAQQDDIVLIAGKGHETYQEVEGTKHHFSDQESILEFYK